MQVVMLVKNRLVSDARVKKEALSLRDAGHRVTVVCWQEPGRPVREDWNGIAVVRTRIRSKAAAAVTTGLDSGRRGPLASALTAVRRSTSARKTIDFWRNALNDFRMLRAARSVRADVYHANDLDTLLVSRLAAVRARARLVYDSHELWLGSTRYIRETGPVGRLRDRLTERLLVRRADAVIAVTPGRAREMSRMYPGLVVDVVENCPDATPEARESRYLPDRLGVPEGTPIALYQGSIALERGLENLIRACSLLPRGAVRVAMIGPDMTGGRLSAMATGSGLGDVLTVLPPVPSEDLPMVTASADMGLILFQNTCPNHYYSLPNKLYEYMMAGIPVVAADLPEMRRVIEEEGCGVLTDPEDPAAIAAAIAGLAADPPRMRSMGGRGRSAALSRYTWSRQQVVLTAIYGRLAAAGRGRTG